MFRSLKTIKLNEVECKYVARVEDDPSERNTILANYRRREFLRAITDTSGLMDAGNQPFETMKIWHDGDKWIAELEAVGPPPNAQTT